MPTVVLIKSKRPTKKKPRRELWFARRWTDKINPDTGHPIRLCDKIGEVGVMTRRAAERKVRDMQKALDRGTAHVDRPSNEPLDQYFERFIVDKEADVRPGTILSYKGTLVHLCAAIGRSTPISKVGKAQVAVFKRYLIDRGTKPATRRRLMVLAGAVMRRAVEDGLVLDNPFKGQAKACGPVTPRPLRMLTIEQLDAMQSVAPTQWWKAFIQILTEAALRFSEAVHLQWQDIDFENHRLHIRPKTAKSFQVGDTEYKMLHWEIKNSKERTVPISEDLTQKLRQFQLTSGGSPYLFLSLQRLGYLNARMAAGTWHHQNDIVSENALRRFKMIQQKARAQMAKQQGVPLAQITWEIASFHDLRKRYGTLMHWHVPASVLADLMGDTVETILKFYTSATEDDEIRVRAALASEITHAKQTLGHGLGVSDAQGTRAPVFAPQIHAGGIANAG